MFNTLQTRAALVVIGLASCALTAAASSPVLSRITPRGAQRGTEVELDFSGQRLADAQEILIYEPGITFAKIEPAADKAKAAALLKVKAKIAPDARLGEYHIRLRTATGISELRSFWVGPFPVVAEKEPNSDFKAPQPIEMNVTVTGVIENEDQDYFVVTARKGQRITAEVEGMRLGEAPFDPYLAILDENRFELAAADDSALHRQDPVVQLVAPKDGKYIVQIRDAAFAGSGASFYRLHVGTFPRPRVVFPLGGQAGQTVKVTYLGDVLGPITQTVKLPDKPDKDFELYCVQDGLTAPSGNLFHVSEFAAVDEVEPNESFKAATAYAGPLPVAFNGIISKPPGDPNDPKSQQDNDYLKFTAKKGQVLDVNVFARRLRSPLDPVMSIQAPTGGQLGQSDDIGQGNPDAYVRFSVPADGEFAVRVRDHLRGAGDQYVYRVEITPAQPSITMTIPLYTNQYSQERNAVTVPKGNRYATLMRIQRQDVAAGPVALTIPGLPAGVKVQAENIEPGIDTVPVLFEAAPDAKVGGNLVELKATPLPADAKAPAPAANVDSHFKQAIELVTNGNNAPFYTTDVDRMAFAVGEEAPFTLRIVEPKVPLVQGGEMNLKIVAQRKKEFTGAINVRMLFKPPGVEAAAAVDIPAGKDEVLYPINASDGAAAKKWKLVVVASADDNGTVWAASPFTTVEVAPPFVTAKVTPANVEQGQNVTMTAELETKTKWDGKAKVELVGLPGNSTSVDRELAADQAKLDFPVTTAKTTPAAKHNGIFLRVTVMKNGEPIIHNIARGSLLRVDAPLVAKTDPKAPATQPATKKPEKVAATDPKPKK